MDAINQFNGRTTRARSRVKGQDVIASSFAGRSLSCLEPAGVMQGQRGKKNMRSLVLYSIRRYACVGHLQLPDLLCQRATPTIVGHLFGIFFGSFTFFFFFSLDIEIDT